MPDYNLQKKEAKEKIEENLSALNSIIRGARLFKRDTSTEPLAAFERTLHSYQNQAFEAKNIESLVKNLENLLNNLSLTIDQKDEVLAPLLRLTEESKTRLTEIRTTPFEIEKMVNSRLNQLQTTRELLIELLAKHFSSSDTEKRLSFFRNTLHLFSAMIDVD